MSENRMGDMIRASVEGIKSFTDMDTVIGKPINTPSGVTVIPISKITIGFASGGLDYGTKGISAQGFGGGGGTGVSISPVGFLTVDSQAKISLIPVNAPSDTVEKVISLVENTPSIIEKIKTSLS